MLVAGYEFEDPYAFRHELFQTRFNKCSGLISYAHDSNDREVHTFDMRNARNTDGQITFHTAGTYCPVCTSVFVYYDGGIVWPDMTTNVPSDTIQNETCGYSSDSEKSYSMTCILIVFWILVAIATIGAV